MPLNPTAEPDTVNAASSSCQKRPMTARMHADRVARAKSAQSLRRTRRTTARPQECQANAAGNSAAGRRSNLTINCVTGECPPYNDHVNLIQDPYNGKMYMFGGLKPGDAVNYDPTSDFYCCDMVNMKWTNLTDRLQQSDAYPFSNTQPHIETLPRLSYPGCTLLRMADKSYIAVFGGKDFATSQILSNIIIIDPGKLEWWPLRFEGVGVNPRISPTIVAINGTIYVFGGYRALDEEGFSGPHHSFSIAEHTGQGVYRWSTRDAPYSPSVPVGHVFQDACPVYNGTKIFLTPGRVASEPITFTQDNCFFYHTINKKFQPATTDVTGIFPPAIRWYDVFSPAIATPLLGSPRKTVTPLTMPLTPHSIIICAFVDVPDTDDVAPEIWHLQLSPEERIECLNIKQKIWDLDSDFQGSAYIDGQVRILGTDNADENDYSNAKWNTYLDIPLKR